MLTRHFPNSGRIMAAQFSVLTTFPCTLLIYRLLPTIAVGGMNTLAPAYGSVFFVTGLLISWCVSQQSCDGSRLLSHLAFSLLRHYFLCP